MFISRSKKIQKKLSEEVTSTTTTATTTINERLSTIDGGRRSEITTAFG